MANNKIIISGLVGGIVAFFVGYLIWGLALAQFAVDNAGTATGVGKESPDFWAIILGSLASGFLISTIFGRWANISTWKTGASAGALIGFLVGAHVNFIEFGNSNVSTLQLALVDIVGYIVMFAVVGAVVGVMLGRGIEKLEEATA